MKGNCFALTLLTAGSTKGFSRSNKEGERCCHHSPSLGGVKNEMLLHSTVALKHRIMMRAIGKTRIFMFANPDFMRGCFV